MARTQLQTFISSAFQVSLYLIRTSFSTIFFVLIKLGRDPPHPTRQTRQSKQTLLWKVTNYSGGQWLWLSWKSSSSRHRRSYHDGSYWRGQVCTPLSKPKKISMYCVRCRWQIFCFLFLLPLLLLIPAKCQTQKCNYFYPLSDIP